MAKITVHGGPSNAHAAPGDTGYMPPPEAPEAEPAAEDVAEPVLEADPVAPAELVKAPEPVTSGRSGRRSSGGGTQ